MEDNNENLSEKKKYNKKYLTKDKAAMKGEIDKHSKKKDDDKSAYGKWPADYKNRNTKSGSRHKTKKSSATKAYEKKYGKKDESMEINEDAKSDKGLKNKSKDSGIAVSILKQVYNRGMAAWKTGHRPGTAQGQWAMGRVNSFITGSGGARKADADLWKKAKKSKESKKKKKNETYDYYQWEKPLVVSEGNEVSESLKYHIDNKLPLGDSVFRYGSEKYLSLINEVSELFIHDQIKLNENDEALIREFSGEKVITTDGEIIIDFIYEEVEGLNEAEYKGKKVKLNKPKRGGSKKFYVYVKDPKSGNVKKVSFGAKSGGGNLSVKLKDPKARKAFADRHNCETKNDKTKPGYWACRLPRYAKILGLSGGGTWW